MIKKRFSAVLIMVVFLISLCTPTFAETSYTGSAIPQIYDSAAGKKVDIPNVAKLTDGAAGKTADDAYYYVSSVCSIMNSGFYPLGGGNTVECQFMLEDETSALILKANLYYTSDKTNGNNATDYNRLIVDTAGIRYYGGRWSSGKDTLKWDIEYDIVPGRWYTLAAEYQDLSAAEGQQNGNFYINGELVKKDDTSLSTYGFRQFSMGPQDGAHGVYLDNIVCSNGRGADNAETYVFDVEKSKVSYITQVPSGVIVSEDLGDVMAVAGVTVGDIKANISTTDGLGDVVTIYNSDFTSVADDNEPAIGKVIVVVSKNGTDAEQAYNYYDIIELDLDEEVGRGKNASDLVTYNDKTTVTSVGGNFGKLASDDVYKVVSTSSEQIHLPKTLANGSGTFGDCGVLEFQFALEPSAYVTLVLNGDATGYQYGKELQINLYENTVSIGAKNSVNEDKSKVDIQNNKWYTVAVTVPTADDDNDNLIKVYLNGKLILKKQETELKSFRRPTLNIYNGYLDNISVSEGSEYNPLTVTPAYLQVVNGVAFSGKISYTEKPVNITDFVIADTKSSVRFFDNQWNVTDVTNAKYVVTAGKDSSMFENIIEYYEMDSNTSDYILAGYTNGSTNRVRAYSKDGSCLYVATYDNDGLASVTPVKLNNEWKETVVDAASKVMLWKDDSTITPLKPIASFDLRK